MSESNTVEVDILDNVINENDLFIKSPVLRRLARCAGHQRISKDCFSYMNDLFLNLMEHVIDNFFKYQKNQKGKLDFPSMSTLEELGYKSYIDNLSLQEYTLESLTSSLQMVPLYETKSGIMSRKVQKKLKLLNLVDFNKVDRKILLDKVKNVDYIDELFDNISKVLDDVNTKLINIDELFTMAPKRNIYNVRCALQSKLDQKTCKELMTLLKTNNFKLDDVIEAINTKSEDDLKLYFKTISDNNDDDDLSLAEIDHFTKYKYNLYTPKDPFKKKLSQLRPLYMFSQVKLLVQYICEQELIKRLTIAKIVSNSNKKRTLDKTTLEVSMNVLGFDMKKA